MSFCFNERDDCSFTYRDGWSLRKHSWSTSRTHQYFEWKDTATVESGKNNLSQHVLHKKQHYSTVKVKKFWTCQTKQCNWKLFFKIDWFNAYIPIANDSIQNEQITIGRLHIWKINCMYTMNRWTIQPPPPLSISHVRESESAREKGEAQRKIIHSNKPVRVRKYSPICYMYLA